MRTLRAAATLTLSAAVALTPVFVPAAGAVTGVPAVTVQTADHAALKARIAALMPRTTSPAKSALDRVVHRADIDGSVYQCGPTEFNQWINASLADFTADDMEILGSLGAFDLPTYEALVFGSSSDPDFALTSDAKVLTKTMKDLRRFWNIRSDDIDLMAMHGDMLADPARTARVYEVVFGVPAPQARELAQILAEFITSDPKFEGGNHPVFTLNAFAFTSFGENFEGLGVIGDRIIMGDGILRAYREMGYGDVAPQAILAHEFGHHVQFELGMMDADTVSTPETTRRTELHADASAAYYLSHPRGASMQVKRVNEFLRVFFSIGDCGFTNPGHHGTPLQRQRSADWAYRLQESARPKGKILTAEQFRDLFDAELPRIVAPDRV